MNLENIIENYISWIRDNTEIRSVKDDQIAEITTPFLDRHNDHFQIYVRKESNNFVLTDDGYTLADLKMSGVDLNTEKRQKIFGVVLNGFGVSLSERDELFIECTINNIGQKKHYFIQALMAVNDMYNMAQDVVFSLFKEDVELYFQQNEIYYNKDIKIAGKSGFDHNFDFIIAASKTKPERLVKTLSQPRKDPVMAAIFAFSDVMSVREKKANNYVIYNDIENPPQLEVLHAFANYGVHGLPWSNKDRVKKELTLV